MPTDETLYVAKLHWIIFLWPTSLLCASVLLGFTSNAAYQGATFIAVAALAWLVLIWMSYHFSSVTIKKNQVILRTGFLVRQTIDVPIQKIETINITQSILGSFLHYGTLLIVGTGGTKQQVSFITHPLTLRRYIEQQLYQ